MSVVIMILVATGGVETNPRPQVQQVKIDQIMAYVKNQEKEGNKMGPQSLPEKG
jgi:hypothetical protein